MMVNLFVFHVNHSPFCLVNGPHLMGNCSEKKDFLSVDVNVISVKSLHIIIALF